jgi:iron complex outermembrane receptor protein
MYGLGGPSCVPNGTIDPADFRAFLARQALAGPDGIFSEQTGLEGLMVALMGGVPNFAFINPDNVVLAMTSDNMGTGGCQFYNPYLTRATNDPLTGPAMANSEELLQWIETPVDRANDTETFLTSVDLVFSGEAFDVPHGTVAMAVGLQYREEGRKTDVNPIFIGSVNSFGMLIGGESVAGLSENRNFDEERDIYAAFLEFQVPLLESLDMQLAARYEDYGGDIGDTFDPKIALRWQATPSLVFRGSASTSFRGPAISQVEEGTGYSLEFGVVDKLGERGAADPVTALNGPNCARTGQCALPSDDAAPRIIIVKQGRPSPNLQPEEAVTYNFGVIWTPQEGALQGLTVGLDWYDIELEDKIIDVPTQSFLSTELDAFNAALAAGNFVIVEPSAGDFGQPCDPTDPIYSYAGGGARSEQCQVNPNAYASSNITRRADLTRDLQIISGDAINTGKVETSGLDANISYVWDTDNWGAFVASGNLNWIKEYKVSDFPVGQPDFDAAGYTNRDPNRRLARSMPELKGNAGLEWMRGAHQAGVMVRFVGEYHDNSAPDLRFHDSLDPYYAVDVRYGYTFSLQDGSALDVTVGAIDLFDASMPLVKDSRAVDVTVFDQRGLRLYGALTYRM